MKLYMSDLYRVEIHCPLNELQQDSLYYLYQPLIGTNALQLYMMLNIEGKRMTRFLKPSALSRLISFMTMSLLDMEKGLRALEAIGLLKTYVKHDQGMTQYVFQLRSPLSLKAFFKNQILSSLLQLALSLEDYQKTIQYFKVSLENLEGYEDVTASFQDVFTIQHHHSTRVLKVNDLKEELHQDIQYKYDVSLLKKGLADYQVNQSRFNHDDMEMICQLGFVYSIDALTMAGFVKDAMKSTGLDHQVLKNNLKRYMEMDSVSSLKEVYHKQPLQYQTIEHNQTPLVLHMKYLDQITPYELLKEKQGGKEPVFHDLMIVETLMIQLGLQPAVVNVLIEYVLGKNQNRLSKRYCEAIGASWARKKITTAMDAYYELMHASQKEEETKENNKVEEIVKDDHELMSLLQQLEEGQL